MQRAVHATLSTTSPTLIWDCLAHLRVGDVSDANGQTPLHAARIAAGLPVRRISESYGCKDGRDDGLQLHIVYAFEPAYSKGSVVSVHGLHSA